MSDEDDIERGLRDEELEGRTHFLRMKQLRCPDLSFMADPEKKWNYQNLR